MKTHNVSRLTVRIASATFVLVGEIGNTRAEAQGPQDGDEQVVQRHDVAPFRDSTAPGFIPRQPVPGVTV